MRHFALALAVAYTLGAATCALGVADPHNALHVRANCYIFGVVSAAFAIVCYCTAGVSYFAHYLKQRRFRDTYYVPTRHYPRTDLGFDYNIDAPDYF